MTSQQYNSPESLDLRGVSCPVNAALAKRAIESLSEGELVRLVLDAGESLIQAVRSINDAGYRIVRSEPLDNAVALLVGKDNPAGRP